MNEREKLIENMAESICLTFDGPLDMLPESAKNDYREQAKNALAAIETTHAVVPRKLDDGNLVLMGTTFEDGYFGGQDNVFEAASRAWNAVIANLASQPGQPAPEVEPMFLDKAQELARRLKEQAEHWKVAGNVRAALHGEGTYEQHTFERTAELLLEAAENISQLLDANQKHGLERGVAILQGLKPEYVGHAEGHVENMTLGRAVIALHAAIREGK